MARYEVAVSTTLGFSSRVTSPLEEEGTVIEFEGSRFLWHPARESAGEKVLPVLTTPIPEFMDTYDREHLVIERLLSALCFRFDQPMVVAAAMAMGARSEMAPPMLGHPGHRSMTLFEPITSIAVRDDDRLRLVLALYREARSANSPFYRFLAFYNALEAAFDSHERFEGFIRESMRDVPIPSRPDSTPVDWPYYLREHLRNAIAHAVRYGSRPVLNPDGFKDKRTLEQAARHVARLVRQRVDERWPSAVRVR